jgi:triosephosphate isomerase
MARRPVIAGNWKMYGTRSETLALLSALKENSQKPVADREVVLAPRLLVCQQQRSAGLVSSSRSTKPTLGATGCVYR